MGQRGRGSVHVAVPGTHPLQSPAQTGNGTKGARGKGDGRPPGRCRTCDNLLLPPSVPLRVGTAGTGGGAPTGPVTQELALRLCPGGQDGAGVPRQHPARGLGMGCCPRGPLSRAPSEMAPTLNAAAAGLAARRRRVRLKEKSEKRSCRRRSSFPASQSSAGRGRAPPETRKRPEDRARVGRGQRASRAWQRGLGPGCPCA